MALKPNRCLRVFCVSFVFLCGILFGVVITSRNFEFWLRLRGISDTVPVPEQYSQQTSFLSHSATGLEHVFFGLTSSSKTWPERRHYVRSWWNPNISNVGVWMQEPPEERDPLDPPIKAPDDIGQLIDDQEYLNFAQMSRIAIEALRMDDLGKYRWFVMGDDDTFFSPMGVAAILSKYDHDQPLYIGSFSETHLQNVNFGHHMAFGGGGFAVSRALALRLNSSMDHCLRRNNEYWGLDERVASCVSEAGVALTVERGFHQCDFVGSFSGLLENHFLEVFASLHHVDLMQSPFPGMGDKAEALARLTRSIGPDPVGFAQQSFCFDRENEGWTLLIAWGYSVKFYPDVRRLFEMERVETTFNAWIDRSTKPFEFTMNTRKNERMANNSDPCGIPFAMFVTEVKGGENGAVESTYERTYRARRDNNSKCDSLPFRLDKVRVIRKQKMDVPRSAKGLSAGPNLPRQCCTDYNFTSYRRRRNRRGSLMTVLIDDCSQHEVVAPSWANSKYQNWKPRLPKRKKHKKKKPKLE